MTHHWNRARVRVHGIVCRVTLTDALKQAGIDSKGYAPFTDGQYTALFGAPAWAIRRQIGLPAKANLRDHLDSKALSMVALAEITAAEVIEDAGCKGTAACIAVGRKVAASIAAGVDAAAKSAAGT